MGNTAGKQERREARKGYNALLDQEK